MKTIKYITIILLAFFLVQPAMGKKRVKPLPMNELTDPTSPSHVPIPYPKNRKEVIADTLYAIDRLFTPKEGDNLEGRNPEFIKIYLNLLEKNPIYHFGKIFKVKNRNNRRAHDYCWLILIEDQVGMNVAGISMNAEGLQIGGSSITPKYEKTYRLAENDVLNRVSSILNLAIDMKKVKSIGQFSYGPGAIGDNLSPAWEIHLNNGKTYFYNADDDEVYSIKERKKRKIKKDGHYDGWRKYLTLDTDDFIVDDMEDTIILLKRHKKKK